MNGVYATRTGLTVLEFLAMAITLLIATAGCDRQREDDGVRSPAPSLGKKVYDRSCATCHESGVAEAPLTGSPHAWAPRLDQGRETLVRHAIDGIGDMPPRGGNPDLSDAEVRAAVDYILQQSR